MTRGQMGAAAYVAAVAVVAGAGFTAGPGVLILLAALVTLPSSVVAVPAYYLMYGLLAQVLAANPLQNTGTSFCTANDVCESTTTGDPASWFTIATDAIGILSLIVAAAVNVMLLQRLIVRKREQHAARTNRVA